MPTKRTTKKIKVGDAEVIDPDEIPNPYGSPRDLIDVTVYQFRSSIGSTSEMIGGFKKFGTIEQAALKEWQKFDSETQNMILTLVKESLAGQWSRADHWVPRSFITCEQGQVLQIFCTIGVTDLPAIRIDDQDFNKEMIAYQISADRKEKIRSLNIKSLLALMQEELDRGITPDWVITDRLLALMRDETAPD
jgi:hypothetical protein